MTGANEAKPAANALLITREQAAQLCQVSTTKLDEWLHRVGCPVIRDGQVVRIPLDAFKRWLEAQAQETNAHAGTVDLARLPVLPSRRFRGDSVG